MDGVGAGGALTTGASLSGGGGDDEDDDQDGDSSQQDVAPDLGSLQPGERERSLSCLVPTQCLPP